MSDCNKGSRVLTYTHFFLARYGVGYKDPFNFQARLPNLYRVPVATPRAQWDQLWRSIPYLAVDIPPQARISFDAKWF